MSRKGIYNPGEGKLMYCSLLIVLNVIFGSNKVVESIRRVTGNNHYE